MTDADHNAGTPRGETLTIDITPSQAEILERGKEELGLSPEFVAKHALTGGVERVAKELENADD